MPPPVRQSTVTPVGPAATAAASSGSAPKFLWNPVSAAGAAGAAGIPPPPPRGSGEEPEEEGEDSALMSALAEIPPEMYSLSIDVGLMGKSFRLLALAVRHLMRYGTYETDIFRHCINKSEADLVVAVLESGVDPVGVALDRYQVNSVASALKRVLQQREPLITHRLYPTMLELQRRQAKGTGQGKYLEIAAALSELPENNKKLLCMLFDMIVQVKHNQAQTKMTAEQLGYTFAPAVMQPAKLGDNLQKAAQEQLLVNKLVVEMIEHHDDIWDNVILESKLSLARQPSTVFVASSTVTRKGDVKQADKSDVTECSSCSKAFGLVRWKTTCVGCGQIFCSACCKHKAPESVVGKVSKAGNFIGKGLLCTPCDKNLNSSQ